MLKSMRARREIRHYARLWADEAIRSYGKNADLAMRIIETDYGPEYNYRFRQIRKAIRQTCGAQKMDSTTISSTFARIRTNTRTLRKTLTKWGLRMVAPTAELPKHFY
jgi:hypothetical protein